MDRNLWVVVVYVAIHILLITLIQIYKTYLLWKMDEHMKNQDDKES